MILEKTSVSQIQTFDARTYGGCERRWYFERVLGMRSPPSKAQLLGTEVDRQITHYLNTGEDVLGLIARAGKYLLPTPMVHLLVQHPTHEGPQKVVVGGLPLVGYIDVLNEAEEYLDGEGNLHTEDDVHEVIDNKTSSDLGYAKSPEDLAETTQMLGYATYALLRAPWLRAVRLSHVTFQTRGARVAMKTTTLCSQAEIRRGWEPAHAVVERMKLAALAPSVNDLPPNPAACDAYRGCPHSSYCIRPKESKLAALKRHLRDSTSEENDMGMLSKKAAATSPAPPAAQAPPKDSVKEEVSRALKNAGIDEAALDKKIRELEAAKAGAKAGAVNPPDASKSAPPTSADPLTAEEKTRVPAAVAAKASQWDATPDVVQKDPPPQDPPNAATRRGPGRPRKAAAQPDGVPSNTPVQAPATGSITNDTLLASRGIVVFVDVSVQGPWMTPMIPLDNYIREQCAMLEEQWGAVDVRCAPKGTAGEYGNWKGAIAGLVRSNLPPDGMYSLKDAAGSELRELVLEALQGHATIIRGHA